MFNSHWCHLIEGLNVSPGDFYNAVESALDRRQIPGLSRSRVEWPEGGLLSAKRIYLRLAREKLEFDICAAPFGTGFFVSSRLIETEIPWLLILSFMALVMIFGCLVVLAIAIALKGFLGAMFGAFLIPTLFVVLVCMWLARWFAIRILPELDKCFMNSPIIGSWYERITRRNTYYRLDLVLMFKEAVHAAVMEVVDQYCRDQHLRPLSELERKPVMSQLLLR